MDVGDKVIRICLQHNIDQQWYEGVGRGVRRLSILQQTKDDFAAIQDADDFVSGRTVTLDFDQLLLSQAKETLAVGAD